MNYNSLRHLLEPDNLSLLQQGIWQGMDVDAADEKGYSLLMSAVLYDNADAVRLLIEAGADIHANDSDHRTAEMDVVFSNNREAMQAVFDELRSRTS